MNAMSFMCRGFYFQAFRQVCVGSAWLTTFIIFSIPFFFITHSHGWEGLNGENVVGMFSEKEFQNKSTEFRVEKFINKKSDKWFVKWIDKIAGLLKKK